MEKEKGEKRIKQFLADKFAEKWIKENPSKIEEIEKKVFDYLIFGKSILFKRTSTPKR